MGIAQPVLDGLWPFLTRGLGLARVWGGNADGAWQFAKLVVPPALRVLAPGSSGYGLERMPLTGGVVLAVNHLAGIDPPLLGQNVRRPVYFMAKAELMATPVVGDVLRDVGVFSVRRGESDRDAIRHALEIAERGKVVGVFAEGTRQRTGHPGPVQAGAAMIAMQAGVPVLPCGLESFGWSVRNRRPCALVFGEPFPLDDIPRNGRGYKEGSERIQHELVRLWRQACEVVELGFPPVFRGLERYRPGWRAPFDAAIFTPEELARRIAERDGTAPPDVVRSLGGETLATS